MINNHILIVIRKMHLDRYMKSIHPVKPQKLGVSGTFKLQLPSSSASGRKKERHQLGRQFHGRLLAREP